MNNYLSTIRDLIVKGPTIHNKIRNVCNHGVVEAFAVGLTYYAVTGDELNALASSFLDGVLRSYQAAASLESGIKELVHENLKLKQDYETLISDLEGRYISDLREDLNPQPLAAARGYEEAQSLASHEDGLARFMGDKGRE